MIAAAITNEAIPVKSVKSVWAVDSKPAGRLIIRPGCLETLVTDLDKASSGHGDGHPGFTNALASPLR